MKLSDLLEFLLKRPDAWIAPFVVLSKSSGALAKSVIAGVEIDKNAGDVNLVVRDDDSSESGVRTLKDIQSELSRPELQSYELYTRRYLTEPMVVEGESFTHMDTPIVMHLESDSGTIALLEWYEGIEKDF